MKPKKIKLQLNKETIANLNEQEMNKINGGAGIFTTGCTDGCTPLGTNSNWGQCSNTACSDDCSLTWPVCYTDFCDDNTKPNTTYELPENSQQWESKTCDTNCA